MFRSRHAYRSPITHRYSGPFYGCPVFNNQPATSQSIESHLDCLKCLSAIRNKRELCKYLNVKDKEDDNTQAHVKAIHKFPTTHPIDKRLKACFLRLLQPSESDTDKKPAKLLNNAPTPTQTIADDHHNDTPVVCSDQKQDQPAISQPKKSVKKELTHNLNAAHVKTTCVRKDEALKPDVVACTRKPISQPMTAPTTIATTNDTSKTNDRQAPLKECIKITTPAISRCPSVSDDDSNTDSCSSSDSMSSSSTISSCSSMSMSTMSSGTSIMSDSDSTHGSPAVVPNFETTLRGPRLKLSEKTIRKLKKRPLTFSDLKQEPTQSEPTTNALNSDKPIDTVPEAANSPKLGDLFQLGPRFVNTLKNYSLNIPTASANNEGDAQPTSNGNNSEDIKRDLIKCAICGIQKRPPDVQKFSGQYSCRECSNFFESFMRQPKQLLCEQDGDCYMTLDRRCKACWIKICLQKFNTDEEYQKYRHKYSPRLASSPHVSLITVDTSLTNCSPHSNAHRGNTTTKSAISMTSPKTVQSLLMMASASPASDSITSSAPKLKKKKKKKKKDKEGKQKKRLKTKQTKNGTTDRDSKTRHDKSTKDKKKKTTKGSAFDQKQTLSAALSTPNTVTADMMFLKHSVSPNGEAKRQTQKMRLGPDKQSNRITSHSAMESKPK